MPFVSCLHSIYDDQTWKRFIENLATTENDLNDDDRLLGGRNDVFKIKTEGKTVVLKTFKNKGAWKKIAYRFSSSKARRSYEHSLFLIEAGLKSPQPIAWREDWKGPWLEKSYYLSEFIDYDHDVSSIQDQTADQWREKAALAGKTIGLMHEAKIEHLDLNSGNLLFKKGDLQTWQSYIIDNNRMKKGAVPLKRGVKSLFLMGLNNEALDLLIQAYAQVRNFDLEQCRTFYFKTLDRHNLKWRIKNKTRPWRRKLGL